MDPNPIGDNPVPHPPSSPPNNTDDEVPNPPPGTLPPSEWDRDEH